MNHAPLFSFFLADVKKIVQKNRVLPKKLGFSLHFALSFNMNLFFSLCFLRLGGKEPFVDCLCR